MEIKVLGTGCAKCKSLEKVTRKAVEELNLDASVEKVEDIQKIMEYAVMRTPALVINEKVVMSGQLPKLSELKELLTQIHKAMKTLKPSVLFLFIAFSLFACNNQTKGSKGSRSCNI